MCARGRCSSSILPAFGWVCCQNSEVQQLILCGFNFMRGGVIFGQEFLGRSLLMYFFYLSHL